MNIKHPKHLSILDYQYHLPEERIAKYPLPQRDQSKLLIFNNEKISSDIFHHLPEHLPNGSFLVFNNTKVVEARLVFQKPNGSKIEIFCLEPDPIYPDITSAMLQKGNVKWQCLIGGAKKWKEGILQQQIDHPGKTIVLTAEKIEKNVDTYTISLSWDDLQLCFAEILHLAGLIPLPPYLNRIAEEADKDRYQTVYAQQDGSVAAPTAGLHFTEELLGKLTAKNITQNYITLHVGAGTFKPVKATTMEAHEMHAEFIDVQVSFIDQLIKQIDAPVIPIGTTSMRTIESLYWLGVKVHKNPSITPDALILTQWEAYENEQALLPVKQALEALVKWLQSHQLERLLTKTQIIIAPGYQFKIAKALITNFHQPQSTLLLLVSALIGEKWRHVYEYALANDYRFLSYGDGSLLWLK
jgi:S-adenosylmethionine:tRNA ribosyltransferase-isomerase